MKKSDQQSIIKLYENASQQQEPVVEIDEHGAKTWRLNGLRHRDDGPAVEYADGTKRWYKHGARHRVGGPAVEQPDGTKAWLQEGRFHRLDGPAIIYPDGGLRWYINGGSYDDVYAWARAALEYQKLPSDESAVKQYVQMVLNKMTDEEI